MPLGFYYKYAKRPVASKSMDRTFVKHEKLFKLNVFSPYLILSVIEILALPSAAQAFWTTKR